MVGFVLFLGNLRKQTKLAGYFRRDNNSTYLKLCIGPSWDLNDHVQNGLLLVGIERDVVEGRDADAILGDVNTVLEGVGGTNLVGFVLRSHDCGCVLGLVDVVGIIGNTREMAGYL